MEHWLTYPTDMTKEERQIRLKELKKPRGPTKRLYSVPEAAFYLGRSVDAVYEMIWAGKLPYVKDGKRNLIDIRDMDAFIEQNKTRLTF
jgi:excisionase family DNA binding protein